MSLPASFFCSADVDWEIFFPSVFHPERLDSQNPKFQKIRLRMDDACACAPV